MKLCVPITKNLGEDSRVSPHFGRAPLHAVVDLETDEIQILQKPDGCDGHDDHGHCMPVDLLLETGVQAVACRSLGRGAAMRLWAAGIPIFAASSNSLREVTQDFRQKKLQPIGQKNLCNGHHDHEHS